MLALHGYDAYGLDVSPTGVETARGYAAAELAAPSEYNFSSSSSRDRHPDSKRGLVKFVNGDFFARDWEKECAPDGEDFAGFDLVYDYTVRTTTVFELRRRLTLLQFLCALLPEMRQDWARRMSELVAPTGVLVCLEFPLYKDLTLAGPPWGLREGIYWDILAAGGSGNHQDEEAARAATRVTAGGAFKSKAGRTPVSGKGSEGEELVGMGCSQLQGRSDQAQLPQRPPRIGSNETQPKNGHITLGSSSE